MSERKVDPIPESFKSYEEAADFWDTHDTTDYLDDFKTVKVHTKFRRRHFEIKVAEDVLPLLRKKARRQGISVERLANDLLREQVMAVG